MGVTSEILNNTSHRPYPIPEGNWLYYQEWNRVLFLHWLVPPELLRKYVPADLSIDTFQGNCYISLVAFTMEKIRPFFLPSIKSVSNFDEINVRTYIDNDDKKGVYFLNIEAGKSLSAFIAKSISGLPYEKAKIHRKVKFYDSENSNKGFKLHAEFDLGRSITDKTELDKWLTERYCLYVDQKKELYRYDVHHREWELKNVNITTLNADYKIGAMDLSTRQPHMTHYSEGVQVIAWQRIRLKKT